MNEWMNEWRWWLTFFLISSNFSLETLSLLLSFANPTLLCISSSFERPFVFNISSILRLKFSFDSALLSFVRLLGDFEWCRWCLDDLRCSFERDLWRWWRRCECFLCFLFLLLLLLRRRRWRSCFLLCLLLDLDLDRDFFTIFV